MAIPAEVAFAGWIPFTIALGLCVTLSGLYVHHLSHKRERDLLASVAGVLALAASLLSSALLPVDVFLVSFMKDAQGNFKDWAVNGTARESIETTVLTAYYVLYGLLLVLGFLVLPFAYFFSEEKDDVLESSAGTRACTAFKYTSIFLLVATVLLTLGAVIPMHTTPPQNSTEWEKIEFLVHELSANRGEDALSFIVSLLTLVGMFVMIFYTGCGLAALPVGLIAGSLSTSQERSSVADQLVSLDAQIDTLRNKLRGSVGGGRQSTDAERLLTLEEERRSLDERQRRLEHRQGTVAYRLRCLLRPVQITVGCGGMLLGLLIWLSLLLVSIDKALHSLGYKMGYLLPKASLPNPLDMALVQSQKVFPIDYVLYFGVVLYLVMCTVYGIRKMGIWFLFLKMYRIRPGRTRPQGILLLCLSLMFAVLALNVLLYSVCPQYTTFGSQHYLSQDQNSTAAPSPIPCTIDAPPADCVMTRASALLLRFFYKAWVFGACYFWATVLLCASYVVAFVVVIARGRQSAVEVNTDDLDGSDDEDLLRA
ncbi:probable lysosomal cobalamin transporter [Ixodes scapularis]|uniref:probable lysosomal cobalamin transporter n=1 Tax=Ixodes scapularis TaxID=6945 RepID=UPI001C395150|nr:probable lysosomal cobalamin transporter [Ixodes scapularis]